MEIQVEKKPYYQGIGCYVHSCAISERQKRTKFVYLDSRIVPQLRQPSSIDVPILGTQRLAPYE